MASEIKQGTLDLINHLPILQVVTPMLIAPVLVVLNNKTFSWLLSFAGALACLFISFNASTWNKIAIGLSFRPSIKGLNFKCIFNSFKVETKEEGPRILTLNLCIF